jgi:hypothetical protein
MHISSHKCGQAGATCFQDCVVQPSLSWSFCARLLIQPFMYIKEFTINSCRMVWRCWSQLAVVAVLKIYRVGVLPSLLLSVPEGIMCRLS